LNLPLRADPELHELLVVAWIVWYTKEDLSSGFLFRCGVLMNLKNKGVLLSDIGRGKELFLGWGWVVGEQGGYSLFFFLPHNMMT
jgi:hypothetical protein